MTLDDLSKKIRSVSDFPKKGIEFKDITTALKDPEALRFMVDELYEYYKSKGITKVVGIESRGFIIGSILAYKLGVGFVLLRKPGKLPASTYKVNYSLEYGTDTLEIHQDAIDSNDVLLLHDDLLATGGSASAAIELLELAHPSEIFVNFIIELDFLNGKSILNEKGYDVYSLLHF